MGTTVSFRLSFPTGFGQHNKIETTMYRCERTHDIHVVAVVAVVGGAVLVVRVLVCCCC